MKRILIVDDDAELRDMLCATLSEAGYEVATAADGTEASAILKTKRPEIVITDVYMPSKDGLEILLDLRQHFPDIKVIAMSGGVAKENILEAFKELGASSTLVKPFEPAELLRAVEQVAKE